MSNFRKLCEARSIRELIEMDGGNSRLTSKNSTILREVYWKRYNELNHKIVESKSIADYFDDKEHPLCKKYGHLNIKELNNLTEDLDELVECIKPNLEKAFEEFDKEFYK